MQRPRHLFAHLLLLAALGCGPGATAERAAVGDPAEDRVELPADAPRLVLLLTIDQGGAAEIDRLRPLLDGGLARLLDESAHFVDAHHEHAVTETSPGHATLVTGRHPSTHGIVANDWLDPQTGEEVYAVDDPELDTSPHLLLTDALGDWLLAAVPEAKVFALGGKDRTAVLLGGRRPHGAFWYDRDSGRFATSGYYDEEPAWLAGFHRDSSPDADYGTVWEPLPEVAAAAERYGFDRPFWGDLDPWVGFPHPLGGAAVTPTPGYYADLYRSPFADAYLGRLAARLIVEEELGDDEAPDLLAIGFSSLDAIGHQYGPDSMEYADTLVRLDHTLGELLDLVDREVGLEHTLIAVSADHGVVSAPEVAARRGEPGGRIGVREIRCLQRLESELDRRLGDGDWLRPGPFFDPDTLLALGVDRAAVERASRAYLETCPGVARVWTRSELEGEEPATGEEAMARLFRHAYHPGRSPDLYIQLEPGYLASGYTTAAGHGTAYPYDTHVPWLVRGADIAPREIAGRVATVDVAPTLAALVGIPVPEDLDGTDRSAILHQPPAPEPR